MNLKEMTGRFSKVQFYFSRGFVNDVDTTLRKTVGRRLLVVRKIKIFDPILYIELKFYGFRKNLQKRKFIDVASSITI